MKKIKVCVFCNKNPINKNKEHVIPDWLIELTGYKNRLASFVGVGTKINQFSFTAFTFPACEVCNSKYSSLENENKKIVKKLLNRDKIASSDLELLMDWLDKVRIGLWLGSIMYSKNPFGIEPHFGAATRPKKDRVLIISLTTERSLRLNFSGFNDSLFHFLPCFFFVYINGICLMSLSNDSLLFNLIPLPNFKRITESREGAAVVQFLPVNHNDVTFPYIGKRFTVIAQVNYPQVMDKKYFVSNELKFIKSNMKSSEPLTIKRKQLIIYPHQPSSLWVPKAHNSGVFLLKEQDDKLRRLRNWIAIKTFKESTNPDLNKLYSALLKSKTIGPNY